MFPTPDDFALPLKDGVRGLRSTIRREARSGMLSDLVFGQVTPFRDVAMMADGVFSRAQQAVRVIRPDRAEDLANHLDRLGRGLVQADAPGAMARSQYRLVQAVLAQMGRADTPIFESLILDLMRRRTGTSADPVEAAAALAGALAARRPIRDFLSAMQGEGGAGELAELNRIVALVCGLAVLVRRLSGAEAETVLQSAQWVVDAEAKAWLALLRAGRTADLAAAWRPLLRYLP
ncbi:hypothetical protein LQ948_06320 [Jiella sp. MQZ9-1]|uniref:Uncharacterized protein n=1 Tax=Jiella flava TaxID=2816857 RepID=A0A939FY52_9HYPH|nr:hypothetical protein [Jiella flava]MBO0662351.1 hypothetical protein [Jiella flava]MCD2470820.1 hypothetical protein [Jiella flava]